jgi:hypothetical protein
VAGGRKKTVAEKKAVERRGVEKRGREEELVITEKRDRRKRRRKRSCNASRTSLEEEITHAICIVMRLFFTITTPISNIARAATCAHAITHTINHFQYPIHHYTPSGPALVKLVV